jgi:hypothetical protein
MRTKRRAIAIINRDYVVIRQQPPLRRTVFSEATGQLKGRLRFSDAERAKLGEIGRRLGRKALGEVANAALPDTILAWYRRLVARKFDGSRQRRKPGRPRISKVCWAANLAEHGEAS